MGRATLTHLGGHGWPVDVVGRQLADVEQVCSRTHRVQEDGYWDALPGSGLFPAAAMWDSTIPQAYICTCQQAGCSCTRPPELCSTAQRYAAQVPTVRCLVLTPHFPKAPLEVAFLHGHGGRAGIAQPGWRVHQHETPAAKSCWGAGSACTDQCGNSHGLVPSQ